MKKFFSTEGKFNIFTLIGVILVMIGIFYTIELVTFIGLLIEYIPQIKRGLIRYKETKEIEFVLLVAMLIIIIIIGIIATT